MSSVVDIHPHLPQSARALRSLPPNPTHPAIQTPTPLPHLGVPTHPGDSMHDAFLKSVFADRCMAEILIRRHAPEWATTD